MDSNRTVGLEETMNPDNSGEKLSLPNFVGVELDRVRDHLRALPQPPHCLIRYQDSDGPRGKVVDQRWIESEDKTLPTLELTVTEPSWLRFLPAQYKAQDKEQWGETLLYVLQERSQKLERDLETLSDQLNPLHCSRERLLKMADISGRSYLRLWPVRQARRVMAARHELDRWRHTKKGLSALLSILLPDQPWTIQERWSPEAITLGSSRLGDARLDDGRRPEVIVWVDEPEELWEPDQVNALRQTLEAERVAGTRFLLRFRAPKDEAPREDP